jgi:hypothetical protein
MERAYRMYLSARVRPAQHNNELVEWTRLLEPLYKAPCGFLRSRLGDASVHIT